MKNAALNVIKKPLAKINKEKLTTLRLYSQQWQDLEEIADKKGTLVSQQIREAVEEYEKKPIKKKEAK
ncbi:MAG: hypothetical protein ABIK53_02215 [bacterium]